MKDDNFNEKEEIIKEFVNSGINVTPATIEFLLNLDEPLKKVKLIIKHVSFLPNFNSHLKKEILQNVSKEEIHKSLKNVLIKKIDPTTAQKRDLEEDSKNEISSSLKIVRQENQKPKPFVTSENMVQLKNSLESNEDNLILHNYHEDSVKNVIQKKLKGTPFERSK